MQNFKIQKISQPSELLAETLRQARQDKNISLEKAASKLNINIKYLRALENAEFNKLPPGIYGKNYLGEYASWLKLDTEKIMHLYNEMKTGHILTDSPNKIFTPRASRSLYFLSIPRLLKNLAIGSAVIILFIYLGTYVQNIITSPQLTITQPQDNVTINKNAVNVEGYTEPEAEVTINGRLVLTKQSGYFSAIVNLKNGLNTIQISAQKKHSKPSNLIKRIFVDRGT